jgi:hypothetical protein
MEVQSNMKSDSVRQAWIAVFCNMELYAMPT